MNQEQIDRIESMEKWLPEQIKRTGSGAGWSLYKDSEDTSNLVLFDYEFDGNKDSISDLVAYMQLEMPYAKRFIVVVRTAKNSKNGTPFTIEGSKKSAVSAQVAGTQRAVALSGGASPFMMEKVKDLEVKMIEKDTAVKVAKIKEKAKKKKKKSKKEILKAQEEANKNPVTKVLNNEVVVAQGMSIFSNLCSGLYQHLTGKTLPNLSGASVAGSSVIEQGAQVAGIPTEEVQDIDKMIADLKAKKEAKLQAAAMAKEIKADELDEDEKLAIKAVRYLKVKNVKDAGKLALAGCYMMESFMGGTMQSTMDNMLKPHMERVEKELTEKA